MKSIKICFFLLLFTLRSFAASSTYYIDFSSINDSGAGTIASPWKYCPGDSRSSRAQTSGSIYVFRGGIVYFMEATIPLSPGIVVKGDAWDLGRAILDGKNTVQKFFEVGGTNNVLISGFEMRFAGYGGAFVQFANSQDCQIKNSYLHERYDWDMVSGPNKLGSYIRSVGSGVGVESSKNIIIDGVEVTKTGGMGITVGGYSEDITIKNCDIHDYIVWMIDLSTYGEEMLKNIKIYNNKIRNMYHYSRSYWTGAIKDEKKNYSTEENPHQDGIFIRQPGSTGRIENVQIFNNEFSTDIKPTEDGGTAQIFTSELRAGTSIYIYNNIFRRGYPNDVLALGWNKYEGFLISVYHNTFLLDKGNAIQHSVYPQTNPPQYSHSYLNNIFYFFDGNTGAAYQLMNNGGDQTGAWSTTKIDYNVFDLGVAKIHNGDFGPDTSDLKTWQDATKKDLNSRAGPVKFVSIANPRLQPGSAAIKSCSLLDFKIYPGSNFDKDGLTRISCDAGAYRFLADGNPVLSPIQNLQFKEVTK